MGIFGGQFQNVIEWNETRDDVIFSMWKNKEIKKGSRLIIRPGQDAIFLNNGKIEGVFEDEGNYEIETEIIPFLTTLKSFKFGFSTPMRAEVLFINTKEFLIKWGTKSPINIPTPQMPGGMPIRCFGTYAVKIDDHMMLIDKVAGIKKQFAIEDVKARTQSILDQFLMRWIIKEGKDMFNLQANSYDIANGIKEDLDMELIKIGLTVTEFTISNFNYPENIQKMIEKNASYSMVGDMDKYQKVGMIDSMINNPSGGMGSMAQAGVGMAMGMEMAKQMSSTFNNSNKQQNQQEMPQNNSGKTCNECGNGINPGSKFCNNCGAKVIIEPVAEAKKFCSECGNKINANSKFCSECGNKS